MTEMFRAQIILERNQRDTLLEIARRRHLSMSEVVRQIVARYIAEQENQEREQALLALEELQQIREKQPIYMGNLVAEVRAERERQMETE